MPFNAFKTVDNYAHIQDLEALRTSFMMWVDWCFADIGAYMNFNINTSGAYGGTFSQLRPASDPRYTTGQVWEAPRSNFVWESGTSIGTPIDISGVYVNNVFYPTSGNINQHYVDYPNGRVIFTSGVPTTSTVRLEYSAKHIRVMDANDIPVFRQTQFSSYRVDSPGFLKSSGLWSQLPESRVQFPILAVDISSRTHKAFEIGNSSLDMFTNINCHVFAENLSDAQRISNTLGLQKDTSFYLVRFNDLAQSGVNILDYRGTKTNDTMTYPEVVAADSPYRYYPVRISDTNIQEQQSFGPDLYKITTRLVAEVIL